MKFLDRADIAMIVFMFCAFIVVLFMTKLVSFLEIETSNVTDCNLNSHQSRPSCWPQPEWESLRENLSCAQSEGKK
mgnify:CR=1 FL=1